ncbi:MAG: amidohydrolase [Streptosporangiales bacterium]|nr:amidohydrolase [Streptosporangiales bacterium]
MTQAFDTQGFDTVLSGLAEIRGDLGGLYRDLHLHPELSFQEERTAGVIAGRLTALGIEATTGVGRTGVVGVLRNGTGPTVLLRADFDALPVREQTGLPYASTATGVDPEGNEVPVMHACGHDVHVTCLLGALTLLSRARETWSGTVLAVFQPAEEIGAGAQAMVDDGLFTRFPKPDVSLGQHVIPLPAGQVGIRGGTTMASADSLEVRMYGRGGHGSQPQNTVDPIVLAASTVLRLQTVVSREVDANDPAVLTVGSLHAGTKANIIPDEAVLRLNIRAFNERVRTQIREAVERIVRSEAAASGAPKDPRISVIDDFPVTVNTPEAADRTAGALRAALGEERVSELPPFAGSEDFGIFGTAAGVPSVFWFFGGVDPDMHAKAKEAGRLNQEVPSNHSPFFAPVPDPTIDTGVKAMVAGALEWLDAPG